MDPAIATQASLGVNSVNLWFISGPNISVDAGLTGNYKDCLCPFEPGCPYCRGTGEEMNLTVKDAAKLLGASEQMLYRWIRQGVVPAYRINDRIRFNRTELLEWATIRRIPLDPNAITESHPGKVPGPTVIQALREGGILRGIDGRSKEEVLEHVVDRMIIPKDVDRRFLLQVMLAREALGSTGIGEGIAIPHVRSPVVLPIGRPSITLAFLEHPIDFQSIDGAPVSILFTLLSPTVRTHLHLLSRLAFVLRDTGVRGALDKNRPPEEIFSVIEKRELTVPVESTARRNHL